MRVYQDLGVPDAADTIRRFLSDPNAVATGATGSAAAVLGSALWDAVTYRWIVLAFTGMWLAWMLLGLFVALHQGEEIRVSKIMAGALHYAASVVIFLMGFLLDLTTGTPSPVASAAFGGFLAVAFFTKAVSKATYFHQGFREFAGKFLPGVARGVGTIEETRSRRSNG